MYGEHQTPLCKRQLTAAPDYQHFVRSGRWWPIARLTFLTPFHQLPFSFETIKPFIYRPSLWCLLPHDLLFVILFASSIYNQTFHLQTQPFIPLTSWLIVCNLVCIINIQSNLSSIDPAFHPSYLMTYCL